MMAESFTDVYAMSLISKFTHWLHDYWTAWMVEKLPFGNEDETSNVAGLRLLSGYGQMINLNFN